MDTLGSLCSMDQAQAGAKSVDTSLEKRLRAALPGTFEKGAKLIVGSIRADIQGHSWA